MKRKAKQGLWPDVSVLIVAVLVISAFFRGGWQLGLLIAAFSIWAVQAVFRHLLPFLRRKQAQREELLIQRSCEQMERKRQETVNIDISDPTTVVMMRHVNLRISAYLQSIYPNATWQWYCSHPEQIVTQGGTGRIRLHGVEDYNFAEITMSDNGDIACQLVKMVPLTADQSKASSAEPMPGEIAPHVWYEKKGRMILSNLVADLKSRGHNSLTLHEDGSISIQHDNKEVVRKVTFDSVPSRIHWPQLVRVLAREGLASSITDSGLVLSW